MSLRHGATLLVVKQDMLGVLFDDVRQPRFVWDVLGGGVRKTPVDCGLGHDDEGRSLQNEHSIRVCDFASVCAE